MALRERLKIVDKSGEEFPEEFDGEDGGDDELAADPLPDERPVRRKISTKSAPRRAPARPATAKIRKEVAEEIQAYLEMAALAWSVRDRCCAEVLSDESKKIADKLTDIIARNPRLLAYFRNAGVLGSWVQLYMVCKPVVDSVIAHHVRHEIGTGEENGIDLAAFPAYTGR